MNAQQHIEAFTLEAHRLAVQRLREQPQRCSEAIEVLRRWRAAAECPARSGLYWSEWERLLAQGPDAVEAAVCAMTDHAATLRSVSPLGRLLTVEERHRLHRAARVQR